MSSPSLELVTAQQLTNAAALYYTSPLGTVTRLEKVSYVNTDTASHTVTVYLVPSGASAAAANLITKAQAVSAGQTLNDVNPVGHYLNAGDKLYALADTGAVVNILVGGTQFT